MTSGKTEFYVTLVSNVSPDLYPDNTNANFKTRLNHDIRLTSGEWAVGLSEISYTKSWHHVTVGRLTYYEKVGDGVYKKGVVQVPVGRYDDVGALVRALNKTISKSKLKHDLMFEYFPSSRKVFAQAIWMPEQFRRITMSSDLTALLGYDENFQISYPSGVWSSRPADLEHGMTGLFVYSNIVANRMVGDTLAPLLRFVPFERGTLGYEIVNASFRNVEYHPVTNFFGREIEVVIRRDNGQKVDFKTGKIVMTLHLRRLG